MRAKKGIVALIATVVAVLFGFSLAACNGQTDTIPPICEEHTFGEWSVTVAGNCKEAGKKKRVCSVCKTEEIASTAIDPDNHYGFTDWVCDVEANCDEFGHEFRTCTNCGATEERGTPKDKTKHYFFMWEQTKAPTCSEEGERQRECLYCGEMDYEAIPVDLAAHKYIESESVQSTCSTHGSSGVCEYCGEPSPADLPFDPHNHSAEFVDDMCPDCHGMLEQDRVLNNVAGKALDSFGMTLVGDFKLEYDFYVKAGNDPVWDNFIVDVRPAYYVDGDLTMTVPGTYAPDSGAFMLIPWMVGEFDGFYGTWWKYYHNTFDTTWFFDENGTDLIYQDCVQKGNNVHLTVERIGGSVSVVAVMTVEQNGKDYDCVVTISLNYPGVDVLYVGLTAEKTNVTLHQATFVSGTVAPQTKKETATSVTLDKTAYGNTGVKNVDGFNLTFEGDFELEYELTMNGDDVNDWHSWILYMFKGSDNLSVSVDGKLYYALAANGVNAENYLDSYKPSFTATVNGEPRTFNWSCRTAVNGNFAEMIKNCTVILRVARKGDKTTVYGTARSATGVLFAYYTDVVAGDWEGPITLRMTSEKATFTVDDLRIYTGTPFTPDGKCVFPHDYDEWVTEIEGTVCKDGKRSRTCSVCGHVEIEITEATADHTYGEWETVKAPLCGTPGSEQRTCSVCGNAETREIAPSGSHEYGEWEVDTEPTCTVDGLKKRVCSLCDDEDTEALPATGHSYGEWTAVTTPTCVEVGQNSRTCSVCFDVQTQEVPVDIYNHVSTFENGVCPDCHGMLTEQRVINNSGGKVVDSFANVYTGDFEVEFTFKQHTGSNGTWHNFILVTGPAALVGGKLVRPIVDETMYVPWTMGGNDAIGNHYGDFWKKGGNSSSTTWFRDENGNGGFVFDQLMKLDPDVVITAKPDGRFLYVKVVMTVIYNDKPVTCTLESHHNMSGADLIYIGMSGESNTIDLKQVKLLKGSIVDETAVETGTDVITEDVVIDNLGTKNNKSLDVTLGEGDFDIEYCYEMAGDGVNDWHSWLLYFYTASSGNSIYWSANGNGTEPDSPQIWHDMAHRYLRKLGNNEQFNNDLKNATVRLRITRRDGYISIVGIGYKQGTTDPFVYWRFGTFNAQNNEQVRLHLTGEACSNTVKNVILYRGTLVNTTLPTA